MTVVFTDRAKKNFLKLDKPIQKQVQNFIIKLQKSENPRNSGKPLVGNLQGFWRYRVGDYRILCKIIDEKLIISVIEIGHRKEIYKGISKNCNF